MNTGTGSQSCTGTYFLPQGKIMVGGVPSKEFIVFRLGI